jgi:hypothetical protein
MLRPFLLLVAIAGGALFAQEMPRIPSVSFQSLEATPIYRGHPGTVQLEFRVPVGFHINSNQPKQEFLKKTELKLDPPTDIAIEKITYPPGEDRSFPFDPQEMLNVYTGDFAIAVTVHPMASVVPAKYAVHGVLKYQACDNAACYPPKQLPMSFEVKVLKSTPPSKRRNPPQSPQTHN